jgi:hypothetical protein
VLVICANACCVHSNSINRATSLLRRAMISKLLFLALPILQLEPLRSWLARECSRQTTC